MRTRLASVALVAAILFAVVPPPSATAQTATVTSTSSLIVKVVAGLTPDAQTALVARNGGAVASSIPPLRLLVVSVPPADLSATLARYQADPQVQSAEQNKVRLSESMPSDALYANQWALPRIGWDQVFGVVTPAGSAKVALLDTGVDASHPELAGKVVAGTSILDGSNGMTDPSGHGTWLAGIIAAQTNNGLEGIAGVAYSGVQILPVTVLNASGEGMDSDVIAGVVWAADHGADVILMAFSNPGFSPNLQDAIDYAWAKGAVIVASAGNNASSEPHFPAGDRGVMGVAATDHGDGQASFSNEGQAVFVAAPGVDITTTEPGGAYTAITGTSAAAAHVAGVAAFMKAANPGLSNGIIVFRIASTADPAGTQVETGNGRINMARAVGSTALDSIQPAGAAPVGNGGPFVGPYTSDAITQPSVSVGSQQGTLTAGTGGQVTFAVTIGGNGNGRLETIQVLGLPTGVTFSPTSYPPSGNCNPTPNQNQISCNFTLTLTTSNSTPAGSFSLTVRVTTDATNNNTATGSATLTVQQANFAVTFNALNIADVANATTVLTVTVGAAPAVSVTKTELPKTFSVPQGTNVSYSYSSPLPTAALTKRYRWNSASGTGNAAASSPQSGSFSVNQASSVVASYVTQFKLTLATNPTAVGVGNIVASPSSVDGFYDDGTSVQLTTAATITIDSTSRYKFKDWTGDLSPSPDTTNPVSVTMNQARSITANYITQFKLTLATNPAAVGISNITTTPASPDGFYNQGQSVQLSATATVAVDTTSRYKFKNWTGDLASSPDTSNPVSVTMSQPRSVTANYVTQFKLTLATVPPGVGGSGNPSATPSSPDGFYDKDTVVSVSATSSVAIDATSRYRFTSWSGDASGSTNPVSVTMTTAKSVTANYVTQFKLTLTTAPSGVGGSANPSATPSSSDGFYDKDTIVSVAAASLVTIDATSRYRFTSWSGDASGSTNPVSVTMTTAKSVTANYVTQFKLTLATAPPNVGGSGNPSATPSSSDGFYDKDTVVSVSAASPVVIDATSRYRFTSWSGDASGSTNPVSVTLSAAKSVTANYVVQFKLTLLTAPPNVGGSGNPSATPSSPDGFYDKDTVVSVSAASPVAIDATSRYRFTYWSGGASGSTNPVSVTVDAAKTVTANYVVQFKLTLLTAPPNIGGPGNPSASPASPDGFYDQNTSVTVSAASPVAIDATSRYRFTAWSGDASGSTNPVSVTMTGAKTITANYVTQFKLTLATAPPGVGGSGNPSATPSSPDSFYDKDTVVSVAAASPVVIDATSRYRFTSWSGDASGSTNPVSVTMDAAKSVTANYVTQFKLTLATAPLGVGGAGNPSASPSSTDGFYDQSTLVSVTAASPVAIDATSRYRFTSWTGDASGSANPVSVTMSAARSVTANYVKQFLLTLAITADVPNGLGNISGGTTATFYDDATILSLSAATPVADGIDKQWGFDRWTGDLSPSPNTSNPMSVTMNQARSINANYSIPTATFAATTPINEGSSSSVSLSGATTTATVAGFRYSFACDGQNSSLATAFASAGTTNPVACPFNNNGSFTVKGRVFDTNNGYSTYLATVTVLNVAPTIASLTGPVMPVPVNTAVSITANFTDPGSLDTHNCTFEWDDYSSDTIPAAGTGNGSCTGTHTYLQAGVFTVRVTVTDSDNASDVKYYEYVVVYDPSAGFVTGGGWIPSPAGAYRPGPTLSGKANFGFVSKYKKGATVPTGETEFQFHAGDFNFHSDTYEYLVIAGPKAQYKGVGSVNGDGGYGFMLTATDGQQKGGGGIDKFRIKIWRLSNSEIVYDNVLDGSTTEDIDQVATQAIGGGSINIQSGK